MGGVGGQEGSEVVVMERGGQKGLHFGSVMDTADVGSVLPCKAIVIY